MPERQLNLTLDFCLRVGEMLLSSGAGAADVIATMQSLAWHYGVRNPEIDITFTSLSMSYQRDPEEPASVLLRHVKQRDIDYEDLTLVDHLVRDVLRDEVDLKEARSRLARIVSSGHQTPRWAVTLGWGLMCAGVGLQLGGGPVVVGVAFLAAACIDRLQLLMARRRLPFFYRQVAGGGIATIIAVLAAALMPDLDPSVAVTANIIMLLAGIGFMGALQDALSGFYVTAGARLTEAMLATAGIIAGVSGGLTLAEVLGVDVGRLDPGAAAGLKEVSVMALGAAICAAAFAFASYAPRRSLAPVGLVSAVAMVIAQSGMLGGVGRTWPTALAAFFVGLVSYTVAGRMRVPPLVVVVPAIVPMLPGLSIYRGLSLLAEGGNQTSDGLLAIITAASVAIALASGVILGEFVAQPLKREAHRLESRLAGPRLVGPLRTRTSRRERRKARAQQA
ncbi:threonine/serine exporter family protein [Nocardioides sp.]|uniref:threonine/serine ThrE exporter family protein n=1 Tax=Nocardioides sp. TaxID=35761 RepID=UPI0025F8DBA1|nr:threonine/serine exporter family protein [Nocardioides sp.]